LIQRADASALASVEAGCRGFTKGQVFYPSWLKPTRGAACSSGPWCFFSQWDRIFKDSNNNNDYNHFHDFQDCHVYY
jgi:hypothetical protein